MAYASLTHPSEQPANSQKSQITQLVTQLILLAYVLLLKAPEKYSWPYSKILERPLAVQPSF
jgi:hypothetical protein